MLQKGGAFLGSTTTKTGGDIGVQPVEGGLGFGGLSM
jgi:hypothetical protein